MKKTIFKNLIKDILIFFLLSSLTLSLIIWILQAVNFLDIVSEDGHSMKTYFLFSGLNFPKILSKILLLSYFISLFYVLSTYEEKNQIIIYWINGITKLEFLKKLILLSLPISLISILLSFYLVPFTQDKARSFIRSSNLDFFPSLIKPKKFVDTVENLTIFLDRKDENSLKRIIIKDTSDLKNTQLIIAKVGLITNEDFVKNLNLSNGIIINHNTANKKLRSFNFETTSINLNKYKTKTTVTPKIQEVNSINVIKCINNIFKNNETDFFIGNLFCNKSLNKNLLQEIYKRIFLSLYIPLVTLVSCFLILKSHNEYKYKIFKTKVFLSGTLIVIFSQISINLIGTNYTSNLISVSFPILVFLFIYYYFKGFLKHSS